MNGRANDLRVDCAVVGAGWRAEFFLRIAAACDNIHVCGMVVRDPVRRAEVESAWRIRCFESIDALLDAASPSYVVASVSPDAMPDICIELARHGVPVLAETPPAPDTDGLSRLYESLVELDARIQVAEQFWAQPLHAARQAVVDSGTIGRVTQAYLSVCHGYHAMSLLRRLLGVGFEDAVIRGYGFSSAVLGGPDRSGPPREERLDRVDNDYAALDFGDRLAQYEFCLPQY